MSRALWGLALVMACGASERKRERLGLPAFVAERATRQDVMVPMPDGVELQTRYYLPEGDGPWPVVFLRIPYPAAGFLDGECEIYVRYAYACVWQMVRGRGGSGGEWSPFVHERDDGLAAVDWIVAQPWSEPRVGMLGPSYLGGVQWAIASARHPAVKTIVPMVFGTDGYDSAYEGGMFRHELVGTFMTLIPDEGFYPLRGRRYQRALAHRPRREMDTVAAGEPVEWVAPWIDAWERGHPYWQSEKAQELTRGPQQIQVPVLLIGGWSDAFLPTQLDTWQALATQADSTLVVGPWDHLGGTKGDIPLGGVDDDVGLADTYFQTARILDWFDHHLKGQPARYPVGKALTYVVGEERWAVRGAWPPPAVPRRVALGQGDAAACNAPLQASPAASDAVATFRYDPADPTPSLGGAGSLATILPSFRGVPAGFVDQGSLCEDRADMLGWASAPLEAPLHLAGAARVQLQVASDAADTAFNVRLLEARPDGRLIHIREGIRALSFRDGDAPTCRSTARGSTASRPAWRWSTCTSSASCCRREATASRSGSTAVRCASP